MRIPSERGKESREEEGGRVEGGERSQFYISNNSSISSFSVSFSLVLGSQSVVSLPPFPFFLLYLLYPFVHYFPHKITLQWVVKKHTQKIYIQYPHEYPLYFHFIYLTSSLPPLLSARRGSGLCIDTLLFALLNYFLTLLTFTCFKCKHFAKATR